MGEWGVGNWELGMENGERNTKIYARIVVEIELIRSLHRWRGT